MRWILVLLAALLTACPSVEPDCAETGPIVSWLDPPEFVVQGETILAQVLVDSDFVDTDIDVKWNTSTGTPIGDPVAPYQWALETGVPFATGASEADATWWATDPDGCTGFDTHTFTLSEET